MFYYFNGVPPSIDYLNKGYYIIVFLMYVITILNCKIALITILKLSISSKIVVAKLWPWGQLQPVALFQATHHEV